MQGGFAPTFGGLGVRTGGLTPDRVGDDDDSSTEVAKQQDGESCEMGRATKGSSTSQLDAMIKGLKHTGEGVGP